MGQARRRVGLQADKIGSGHRAAHRHDLWIGVQCQRSRGDKETLRDQRTKLWETCCDLCERLRWAEKIWRWSSSSSSANWEIAARTDDYCAEENRTFEQSLPQSWRDENWDKNSKFQVHQRRLQGVQKSNCINISESKCWEEFTEDWRVWTFVESSWRCFRWWIAQRHWR